MCSVMKVSHLATTETRTASFLLTPEGCLDFWSFDAEDKWHQGLRRIDHLNIVIVRLCLALHDVDGFEIGDVGQG